jgi:hypothetical protein
LLSCITATSQDGNAKYAKTSLQLLKNEESENRGSCVLARLHQIQEGSVNACLESQEQKS